MSPERKQFIRRRLLPATGFVGLGFLLAHLSAVGLMVTRGYDYLRGPSTGSIHIRLVDGTRHALAAPTVLLRVFDGNQKEVVSKYVSGPDIRVDGLTYHDNFGDRYTVLVWARGYKQAGYYPVKLSRGKEQHVDLMLLPDEHQFDFRAAAFDTLQLTNPQLWSILASGASVDEARARYQALLQTKPSALAHVLNVAAALQQVVLPSGESALPMLKQLVWDGSMQQNEFWGYADASMVQALRQAVTLGTFDIAAGSQVFHPGNTASFKETSFNEANLQITFYEKDVRTINGVNCVKVEIDIDYYRDPAAHIILEVIPNNVAGRMTDPVQVYQLRWIASQQFNGKPFAPAYSITPKQKK